MDNGNRPQQIPGQMDLWECIEVALTGSDGKPPAKKERGHQMCLTPVGRNLRAHRKPAVPNNKGRIMRITLEVAQKHASEAVDQIVERIEAELGFELADYRWEEVTSQIEADLAEAIVDAFAAHA